MGYRASADGSNIRPMPLGGVDTRDPHERSPDIPVLLISDREGMFGRICPACHSYFRTDYAGSSVVCPYCIRTGASSQFLTENQKAFVKAYVKVALESLSSDKEVTINLESVVEGLPDNRPGWIYSETAQQHRFSCSECRIRVDVLGDYASCPNCAKRNWLIEYTRRLDQLEARLAEADQTLSDRTEREEEWERLLRCVSEFESLANDVKGTLRFLPLTPRRRNDLLQLSFQNPQNAARVLNDWFGFDLARGISQGDLQFLAVMFCRRHLFTHNAGRVDEEYLRVSGDSTVKLHQRVRLRSNEMKRLVPLVRKLGTQLIEGVESLTTD